MNLDYEGVISYSYMLCDILTICPMMLLQWDHSFIRECTQKNPCLALTPALLVTRGTGVAYPTRCLSPVLYCLCHLSLLLTMMASGLEFQLFL